MRARDPDRRGFVVRDGVRVYYEVAGPDGAASLLLLPAWAIVHSRMWKLQVSFLARQFRVITFDPRGNGRSDRPRDPSAYADTEIAADALAVLDATGTSAAVAVGLSRGAAYLLRLIEADADRVLGAVFAAPAVGLGNRPARRVPMPFEDELETDAGWAKYNAHYWRRDLRGFAEFFFGEAFTEPHATKAVADGIEWALQTDAETLITIEHAPYLVAGTAALAARVRCPSLVVHGDADRIVGVKIGRALADLLRCPLEIVHGGGHLPNLRHPVRFNHVVRDFVRSVAVNDAVREPRETAWLFARERKRRALYVSSPIGLGHVLRDLAIARALRAAVPDLEIHWWVQPPVTAVLEAAGEIIHPASAELASESAHWESEATHHDLHAFYAFRRMDEIFCANYMLFDDVVRETSYDLWIGDESWEVDHFLHENPERKIAPYAFLTDVIGFLPVDPDGDPREADLCADYNAEMIEHLDRFPYVRDRSVFIGAFAELPDAPFGPGLPRIRDWSAQWFTSVPYIVPFDPARYRRPTALRRRLGYGVGYPLYLAAVGGTNVGRDLLGLAAEAFALVRREQPDARMVMVTGPRLHPSELPDVEGMDKRGYVPDLFEHLACADVSIVQGGLSTTMELTAARRPFVYFPIERHWEQQHFVAHRLDHYGAGVRMQFTKTTPAALAEAMLAAYGHRPAYLPVRRGGAAKAAAQLAAVLRR